VFVSGCHMSPHVFTLCTTRHGARIPLPSQVSSAKTFKKQGADWFCRLALHKLKRKPTPSRSVPSSPKHMALALAAQYVREREHGRPVAFAAAAAAVTGAAHLCRWWRPRCST